MPNFPETFLSSLQFTITRSHQWNQQATFLKMKKKIFPWKTLCIASLAYVCSPEEIENVWLFFFFVLATGKKRVVKLWSRELCVRDDLVRVVLVYILPLTETFFALHWRDTNHRCRALFFASVRKKVKSFVTVVFFLLRLHSAAYQSTPIDSKFSRQILILMWGGFVLIDVSFFEKHLFDVYIFFFFLSLYSVFPVNDPACGRLKFSIIIFLCV